MRGVLWWESPPRCHLSAHSRQMPTLLHARKGSGAIRCPGTKHAPGHSPPWAAVVAGPPSQPP